MAGCTTAEPVIFPPGTATATAFLPVSPSPTPADIRLWIAPEVPEGVRAHVLDAASSLPVRVVESQGEASVRLEPDGEAAVASWIYALTGPFPTVADAETADGLAALWGGDGDGRLPIFVEASDLPALSRLLGTPGEGVFPVGEERPVVDAAWDSRPSRAIVPFDELEPRWKVLQLDGASVLDPGADLAEYPLEMEIGLSGDPTGVDQIRTALTNAGLELPLSNRRPDRMTIAAVTGVTALTRATAWQMDRAGMTFPARDIGDWLRQADITHISNEVAFDESCPDPIPDQRALRFCSSPRHFALLDDVDPEVIELTGNHILDVGPDPFLDSLGMYRERGWSWFGGGADLAEAGRPAIFEHNGNRIAFLGCNEAGPTGSWAGEAKPGSNPCGADRLTDEIRSLRADGVLPIFTFQWHEHYAPKPPLSQQEAFRAAAGAGAVGVSGSQAHQPMGFAFEDGGFIHYGLGNLFFDQMWSNAVRQEFIDRYVFHDGRLISVELLTAYLEDWSRPRPMTPDERAAFLEDIFAASGW